MDIKPYQIDLNADVGEGINNETLIMPFISSCNIACGGHAGNEHTILTVLKLSKKYHVRVGAHPSFPDTANFGRLKMEIPRDELLNSLKQQVTSLMRLANSVDYRVTHLKPHGALYNLAAKDVYYAEIIMELILNSDRNLKLYAPQHSVMAQLAKDHGVAVVFEGFADRSYCDDLSLVSRSQPNAVIQNPNIINQRVLKMIVDHQVETISGLLKPINVDTICVHGDTDNAVDILRQLHQYLIAKNIQIGKV